MKYVKASDVLPPDLLNEVLRYIDSCVVYIPRKPQKRKAWGENSGAKDAIQNRNARMRAAFRAGTPILELSDTYCLAIETVKKIVYSDEKLRRL